MTWSNERALEELHGIEQPEDTDPFAFDLECVNCGALYQDRLASCLLCGSWDLRPAEDRS